MKGSPNFARIGALLGDPARAAMLNALMSGKALTASELAREAGVTVQTASSHLGKLEQGNLLQMRKQGRHKYFTLANDEVAAALEALMGLVEGQDRLLSRIGPRDEALRNARVCYNHLAGSRGIELHDTLIANGHLKSRDGGLELTTAGYHFATDFDIDVDQLRQGRALLCRPCLDWSERRSHLAGSLGRAFFSRFEALGWIIREPGSRVVTFTRKGESSFAVAFQA